MIDKIRKNAISQVIAAANFLVSGYTKFALKRCSANRGGKTDDFDFKYCSYCLKL